MRAEVRNKALFIQFHILFGRFSILEAVLKAEMKFRLK